MATFADRLRELRLNKDVGQKEVGAIIDVSDSSIRKYESGERTPDPAAIVKLADFFGVTTDYLLGRDPKTVAITNKIPLLGKIRAGLPLLADGNIVDYIEVPKHIKADFCCQVIGDSMEYIGIHEGDIAIFRQRETAQNGQVVAARKIDYEDEINLKFYIESKGQIMLRSANPKYRDIEWTSKYKIGGHLVAVIKEDIPGIREYESLLTAKEIDDEKWTGVIAKAIAYGLSPEHIGNLLDIHATFKSKLNL